MIKPANVASGAGARNGHGTGPIGVGILSTAHIAHATAYTRALDEMEALQVVGVYDEDSARGQEFAERYSIAACYQDPEKLLAHEKLDAVVLCSSTDRHAPLLLAAAEQGKHVLCEKPIATRMADGWAMVQACRRAGVQFHVAYTSRFYPMVQEAKRLIETGEIGAVIGMRGGNRGIPPIAGEGGHPAWLLDTEQAGGGALIDHSVHVTDVMRYLLDDEVVSVFAEAGTLIHKELAVEDCAVLLLRFSSGVVASVDPSWSIPAKNPYSYDLVLHIVGSHGAILIDDTRQALRVVHGGQEGHRLVLEPFGVDIDGEMVRGFVESIREGKALLPCATGEDGLRSLEIALAAYESTRLGRPVSI